MRTARGFCALLIMAAVSLAGAAQSYATVDVLDKDGKTLIAEPTYADIPTLVEYLVNGGVEARYAKIDLIELGDESVPELTNALSEGKGLVDVLYVLGQIMDPRAIDPISDLINNTDNTVSSMARGVLVSYGDAAVPRLTVLLSSAGDRDAAEWVLQRINPSDNNREAVRKLTESGDPGARGAAAYLLGVWRDKDSEGTIVKLFGDSDASVRLMAAKGYEKLHEGDPDGVDVDAVLKLLQDKDASIRAQGAAILGRVKDRRVVEPLLNMVKNEKDPQARYSAVAAFENRNEPAAVVPLIGVLSEKGVDHAVLEDALYILGEMKASEALPYILDVSKSDAMSDVDVQTQVFNALAKIGEPVDLKPLLAYLKPGGPEGTSSFELLSMINVLASPGDEDVIAAVKRFRDGEHDEGLKELANKVLERLE